MGKWGSMLKLQRGAVDASPELNKEDDRESKKDKQVGRGRELETEKERPLSLSRRWSPQGNIKLHCRTSNREKMQRKEEHFR